MENYFLVGLMRTLGLGYSLLKTNFIPLVCLLLETKNRRRVGGALGLASSFGFDLAEVEEVFYWI
jgi:hypothetical protein